MSDVGEAVKGSGVGLQGDRDGGDGKLDILAVAVKMEVATKDDLTEEKKVEDEEERTEHRSLGHTLVQGFSSQ